MKIRKILCPTDFSDQSVAAIQYAASLAKDCAARLYIVHVQDPPETFATASEDYPFDRLEAEALSNLSHCKPDDTSVGFSQKLLTGFPDSELLSFAERERVDLIVMGTHGRTGLNRILLGSVAEAVIRHAQCPVLTVKLPKTARQVA